jgi:hypothetical protein
MAEMYADLLLCTDEISFYKILYFFYQIKYERDEGSRIYSKIGYSNICAVFVVFLLIFLCSISTDMCLCYRSATFIDCYCFEALFFSIFFNMLKIFPTVQI